MVVMMRPDMCAKYVPRLLNLRRRIQLHDNAPKYACRIIKWK